MRQKQLAAILTNDLVGRTRGRAVSADEFESYLKKGSGWVPANLALDPFGRIIVPNPFGSVGDLKIMPDATAVSAITPADSQLPMKLVLGDLVNTDGTPWSACPRTFLRNALSAFEDETGLMITSSFEHEFMLRGDRPEIELPFSLQTLLEKEPLGGRMLAALEDAGLEPEMWLPEFGSQQWEVTLKPADALVAADRAIYLREIVRNTARSLGHASTMTPIVEANGGGNGVHVHLSLRNQDGEFVTYDPNQPSNLSQIAGSFAAGILHHARAISALVASSVVSYERLAPNRWSVGGIFLGENNREALLRICPLFDLPGANFNKQFNLEFRGADATSNPWIALAVMVLAGLDGIRRNLPAPRVVHGDLAKLSAAEIEEIGIGQLPATLDEALDALTASEEVCSWLPEELLETFLLVKRAELEHVRQLSDEDRYNEYAAAY